GITPENHQVRELAGFDGAFQVFFVRSMGAVDSADADRFFDGDFLFWSPDIAFCVGASDFRLQRHHGDKFSGRIVGSLRRANAGVKKAAQGEHVIQTLGAVIAYFFAVVINVSLKRSWDCAKSLDTRDQAVIDDRAVLEAEARI